MTDIFPLYTLGCGPKGIVFFNFLAIFYTSDIEKAI